MSIIVTGGLGYIGSHVVVDLLHTGRKIVILDDCSNASYTMLLSIQKFAKDANQVVFYDCDVTVRPCVMRVLTQHLPIHAIFHFAADKYVKESVYLPLKYYDNNINATLNMLMCIEEFNIPYFLFSSSATVYGTGKVPHEENDPIGIGISNPYGQTKYVCEKMIQDYYASIEGRGDHQHLQCAVLRYFNPLGYESSGTLMETRPNKKAENVMPMLKRAFTHREVQFNIFGGDYNTPDGTAIRDYIHIVDLSSGHSQALEYLETHPQGNRHVFNLGTEKGTSVAQLIHAMESVYGIPLDTQVVSRRSGDIAISIACTKKAHQVLGWTAKKTIEDMCYDERVFEDHV